MEYEYIVGLVRDLGFPIVVALFVLFRLNGSLDKLKIAIDKLSSEMQDRDESLIKLTGKVDMLERTIYRMNKKNGKKYGKWILRKAYENDMPKSIVWREKSPMQDGSGTSGLTKLFDSIIPDNVFNEKITEIKTNDDVQIRTKESLHYYEIFRKKNKVEKSLSELTCPDCKNTLAINTKFCQMCGKFPI